MANFTDLSVITNLFKNNKIQYINKTNQYIFQILLPKTDNFGHFLSHKHEKKKENLQYIFSVNNP